jgi:hypothetical protein
MEERKPDAHIRALTATSCASCDDGLAVYDTRQVCVDMANLRSHAPASRNSPPAARHLIEGSKAWLESEPR